MHPYEDEQYLRDHPDVREKIGRKNDVDFAPPSGPPPAGEHRASSSHAGPSTSQTNVAKSDAEKRGFFGKMKDKAIGTKEEREARRRYEEEQMRRAREAQRQRDQQRQQQYLNQQQAYPRYQQGYPQQYPQQYPQMGYQQQAPPRRTGGLGGGGMAVSAITVKYFTSLIAYPSAPAARWSSRSAFFHSSPLL